MAKLINHKMKKTFCIFLSLLLLASCTLTKAMWRSGYEDRIQSFMLSNDGSYIVFIGGKYHYIMNDGHGFLRDILSWNMRAMLMVNTSKTVIKVDEKNHLVGEVVIETVNNNFTRERWAFLQAIGFRYDEKNNIFVIKISVTGKRYLPRFDQDLPAENLPALTVPYQFFISEKMTPFKKACAAALTPITVTIDGVLMIGKVVLMPWIGN